MAPPEYAEIPSPRLAYAGALDGRFGYEAVSATAKCLPHANFILIGPYGNDVVKQLGAGANIHLLGPRIYHQLPAYFQHADIGLLPLRDHPANAGRSPMKLFEYGASGLPVVATRTAELTRRKLDFLLLADLFSTGLANLGIIGFLLTTCIFIDPAVKLGRIQREVGIKASLIVIFITIMLPCQISDFYPFGSFWVLHTMRSRNALRACEKTPSQSEILCLGRV